jgi:hypothetical protein
MTDSTEGLSASSAADAAVDTAAALVLAEGLDAGLNKPFDSAAVSPHCLNCGAAVRGRYCVDCGQVTDTHIPTLGEVFGDALVSVFNLDSRLWRTLAALFFYPGRLTQDFLAGKRARYVPPLRLYLVLSVFLFLLVSLSPDNDNDEDEADDLEAQLTQDIKATTDAAVAEQVNAELEAAGLDPATTVTGIERDDGGRVTFTNPDGVQIELDGEDSCDEIDVPFVEKGDAFDTKVRDTCVRNVEDGFRTIGRAFLDNVPLLAFLVIPVMAVVFKVFYLFTGKPYLQHLIFLCHTHAFTFLLFMVWNLLLILDDFVPGAGFLSFVWFFVLLFYSPVYYFLAMRRTYEQGRLLTLVKLPVLMLVYLFVIGVVFMLGFFAVMLTS